MDIKLRVWSKTLGKYRQLDGTSNDQGLGMLFEVQKGIGSNVTSICHSIDDVVEQFTGLKDANGNEIYEGDIIQYFGANRRMKVKKEFGVVVFKTDKYGSKFTSVIQNAEHGFGGISPLNDLVVGDIHNNPELLKANK